MDKQLKQYKEEFIAYMHDTTNIVLQGKECDFVTRAIIARCEEIGKLSKSETELFESAKNWRKYVLPTY